MRAVIPSEVEGSPLIRKTSAPSTALGENGEWRTQLLALLDVARLGSQFPDSVKWRSLLELLGRESRRPLVVERSDVSGLPTMKALTKLHRLRFVAREFFRTHHKQPAKESRAFSMALAALELPPVSHTQVRLMTKGKVNRFVLLHERLERCAAVSLARSSRGCRLRRRVCPST